MPTEGHLSFLPQDETAVTTKANTRIILNFFINNLINSSKIKEYLANKELRHYLNIANTVGNQAFILKYKSQLGDFASFIAEQSKLAPKLKNKLPNFYEVGGLISTRSLEQCTAEAVAEYKALLIIGNSILTLASGIGIDDLALAKGRQSLVSVDNDEVLNTLAQYNFNLMGANNIQRITQTAEEFIISNTKQFDAVYIDPDRRDGEQRQLLLSEHQPNVIALLPSLLKISNQIWIKCSPLYDIDMALKELSSVEEVHVISLKGEVKEMLLKVGQAVNAPFMVVCTDIGTNETKTVALSEHKIPFEAETIEGFFYEAGGSLVKARQHHSYAASMDLLMLDKTVPFYIGASPQRNFMGKVLGIKTSFPLNPKQIKVYLKAEGLHQINIKARGVKCDVHALFKALGIKEGGEDFLFLAPFKGKQLAIHCTAL